MHCLVLRVSSKMKGCENFLSGRRREKKAGSSEDSGEATPVPISNTVVKLLSADDTWWEAAWESRTLPVFIKAPWSSG